MDIVKDLQGDEWLGHPAHPAFVALPIGMWTFSLIMDMAGMFSKNECVQEAADRAIIAGILGAGVSAAAGLAEYSRVPDDENAQADAFTHGALNVGATALYGINAGIRAGKRRDGKSAGFFPKLLSLTSFALIGYTGWLGGTLAYNHGVGVSKERGKKLEARREEMKIKAAEKAREVRERVKART